MAWPYAFIDLSDAEKIHRRELLDWYGFLAQISVIFPLLVLQVYFLVIRLQVRWQSASSIDAPSSPRIKGGRTGLRLWTPRWRKGRWWMGEKVVLGGDVIGSRGELLGATAWLVWLALLSLADTWRGELQVPTRFRPPTNATVQTISTLPSASASSHPPSSPSTISWL